MKHLVRSLFVAALFICCSFQQSFAQQQMPPIPVDPNVRIGKLENGLTYYIRKNSLPADRADFYIAQKVGSIQEEENQRGLAHFLEHMCFNGTTHFPGDALKQYLERIGVKFGENLNAYTSVDETVYNISNVPVTTPGAIDSCLLILHDWSNDLTLDPKEIDKERGVINEEWRTRMSANYRMMEKMLPQMYAGTKYATCFPIGTMDVVMNFKYQTLRDYYEKWYRPDLQGVVVVGDIDVDAIEAKIKTMFADIPAQPNAAERVYYPVNDNKEPIVIIEKDKEQTNIQAMIFYKHDIVPDDQKGNIGYLVHDYAASLIGNMLNARLNELTQTATPPFIYAYAYDGEFFVSKTKDAFTGIVVAKEGEVENGIASLLREMERARKFGFTESEYTRARAEYLRNLESAYNERDKQKNDKYVNQYVRNFLDNEPIPGIENEYALVNQVAPHIQVGMLNQMMQSLMGEDNQVVVIFAPDKEGIQLPTKEAVAGLIKKVESEDLTAYVDKVSDEPLMAEMPKGGKIVSQKPFPLFDATELTLSNGVKVILKKTDFKADEILMGSVSLGGTSLFPDSEIINIKELNDVMSTSGLGNFTRVDLEKVLAGKKASARASVGNLTEAVSGNCSPKDLETMLQLTYLSFTAPHKDEDAFTSLKNRLKASLQNMEMNPQVAFSDSIQSAVYGKHPRNIRLKANMVDQIDYNKILSMYQDRFKDASDFTFYFVGNIDIEKDKDLIAGYLGALPVTHRKETFKDNKLDMRQGTYKNEFVKEQETPKASVLVLYNGTCNYDLKSNILMSMTTQILDLIYTEKVREEEGGTYGVYVGGNLDKFPKTRGYLQIIFDTAPEKKEKLMTIIFNEAKNLAKNGPSAENLNKVKEYMLKKHSENLKENGYWLNAINEYVFTGLNEVKDYETIINNITVKDVQKFADDFFKQNNELEVTMTSPEKK